MARKASTVKNTQLTDDLLEERAAVFLLVLNSATGLIGTTERTLREMGSPLTAREWDVLAFVSAYGPIRPSELLRHAVLTGNPQTLSSILDRLQQRQFVSRDTDESDARSVLISITEHGSKAVHDLFPTLALKVIEPFNLHYTAEELSAMRELLERL
jgi:MarR family 2-MHQ and catechol resistance regulon transcriptional repressor